MRFALLLACTLTFHLFLWGQSTLDKQLVLLTRVIEKNHYQPAIIDDTFSSQVFNRLLNTLDPLSVSFTLEDINKLEPFRYQIDDEMRGKKPLFAQQLAMLFENRLRKMLPIIDKLEARPFEFDSPDFFIEKKQDFPADEKASEQKIYRYYKMKVLEHITDEQIDNAAITKSLVQQMEAAARKKVLRNAKAKIEYYLSNGVVKQVEDTYLQIIASNYDPHTNFFGPEEKKQFDEALSSENFSFGFSLKLEGGKCLVQSLTPGGAAWRSGNIHKNDEVTGIVADGKNIQMDGIHAPFVLNELEKASVQKITVTVTSADGITRSVMLQKQQQQNEENTVRGYILNSNVKAGYIALPSFYTEWGNNGSSSCANDVAKEIVKLKRDGIAGLILDLRYNQGGSLQEALELMGIFIDVGPGCLVRDNLGGTTVLKDPNRGTMYDGPLVIMINGQSASASELVAGTLQDYKRALIVGSRSFGKATMQAVYPLDTTSTLLSADSELARLYGYVKVTGGKLFRITGKTVQLNGVTPDIILPDAFHAVAYTERSFHNAMTADTIVKKVVFNSLPGYKTEVLSANSKTRVTGNAFFNSLNQFLEAVKNRSDTIPLEWQAYIAREKKAAVNNIKIAGEQDTYTVSNNSFDTNLIRLADYLEEREAEARHKIRQDHYIGEVLSIINDIIKNP